MTPEWNKLSSLFEILGNVGKKMMKPVKIGTVFFISYFEPTFIT